MGLGVTVGSTIVPGVGVAVHHGGVPVGGGNTVIVAVGSMVAVTVGVGVAVPPLPPTTAGKYTK